MTCIVLATTPMSLLFSRREVDEWMDGWMEGWIALVSMSTKQFSGFALTHYHRHDQQSRGRDEKIDIQID